MSGAVEYGKSVLALSAATGLQILAAAGAYLLLYAQFGASLGTDAFFLSAAPVVFITNTIASGLVAGLLPTFAMLRQTKAQSDFERFSRVWFTLLTLVILVLFGGAALARSFIIDLVVVNDAPSRDLAVQLLIPQSLLSASFAWHVSLSALSYLYGRLALPLLLSSFPLLGIMVGTSMFSSVEAATWGGGIAGLIGCIVLAAQHLPLLKPSLAWRGCPWRFVARLSFPVMAASCLVQLVPVLERGYGSSLTPGTITVLALCGKVASILVPLSTGAVGLIAFTRWSAEREKGELGTSVASHLVVLSAAVSFLAVAGIWVASHLSIFVPEDRVSEYSLAMTILPLYLAANAMASLGVIVQRALYSVFHVSLPVMLGALAGFMCYVLMLNSTELTAMLLAQGTALFCLLWVGVPLAALCSKIERRFLGVLVLTFTAGVCAVYVLLGSHVALVLTTLSFAASVIWSVKQRQSL